MLTSSVFNSSVNYDISSKSLTLTNKDLCSSTMISSLIGLVSVSKFGCLTKESAELERLGRFVAVLNYGDSFSCELVTFSLPIRRNRR